MFTRRFFSVLTQLTFGTTLFCHFCYLFSSRWCEVGTLNLSLDLHGVATWLCGGIIFIARQKQWRLSSAKRLLLLSIYNVDPGLPYQFSPFTGISTSQLTTYDCKKQEHSRTNKKYVVLKPSHPPKSAYIIFKYQKNTANKCHRQYHCIYNQQHNSESEDLHHRKSDIFTAIKY